MRSCASRPAVAVNARMGGFPSSARYLGDPVVGGPKVGSPAIDAVRLIDYEKRWAQRAELFNLRLVIGATAVESLRRKVEELERPSLEKLIATGLLCAAEITVDERSRELQLVQVGDLVLHERLERR